VLTALPRLVHDTRIEKGACKGEIGSSNITKRNQPCSIQTPL
jgi:hypothetical protein